MFPVDGSFNMSNQKLEKKNHTWPSSHVFLVHTTIPRSHVTTPFTYNHHYYFSPVHIWPPRSYDHTPFTHDHIQTWPNSSHNHSLVHMWSSSSHETVSFSWPHPIHMTSWPQLSHVATPWTSHLFIRDQVVMVLRKCLDTIYHHAIYEANPLKGLQIRDINLQHENSKSVTLAFRPGVREFWDPYLATDHNITESI